MKKRILILIACCICLGLAACGSENNKESEPVTETVQTEESPGSQKQEQQADTSEPVIDSAPSEEASGSDKQEPQADTSESVTASAPAEEAPGSDKQDDAAADADTVTEDEALEAIKKYCSVNHPEVNEKLDSDEYTMYWSVSTNENDEIVVLFRSYTGALTRYYVDPATGQTYVTEQVPGIIDDEQRTEETLNIKEFQ